MPMQQSRGLSRSNGRSLRLRVLGFAIAALLLTIPASAGAVSVRAESGDAAATLSVQSVTPTTGPVTGNAGTFSCAGTGTAAGALNAATSGNWGGEEFFGDFQVGRIAAVDLTTAPTAPYYWSFNVNEVPASAGICATQVAANDRILFYKACNVALTGCYTGTILTVAGPPAGSASPTGTFTVEQVVTTYGPSPTFTPTTTRGPAAGATVTAGGASALTGADGKATLTLTPGQQVVRATRGSDVPGETTLCAATANDGTCGTVDRAYPVATISIADGKRYRKRGPRSFSGTAIDAAGVKQVRLRLTERPSIGSKDCTTFDADSARFVSQRRCGALNGKQFTVEVSGGKWSYLLPKAPGKGRYVLDAIITDSAGNTNIERAIFYVK